MKSLTHPRGLIVISLVLALAGMLSLVGGIIPSAFSLSSQTVHLGFLQFLAPILPLVLIVLGVFYLGLSYGVLRGYSWAWTANVAFILIHILADIGFVASRNFAIDKVIGLAILVSMLGYLLLPGVRAYFATGNAHGPSGRPLAVKP